MNFLLNYIPWSPDPVLLRFGSFELRYYSLFFAFGFILGYMIILRLVKKEGEKPELLDQFLMYVVIGTILGARLGHCIFYDWEYFSQHPLEMFLPVQFEPEFQFTGFRGLASHGGAFGITAALLLLARRQKKSVFWYLDKLAVVVPLAGMFIRLGNLMNSEIVGEPTDLPWAFQFRLMSSHDGDPMEPRHPSQLYEAISYLAIFGFMFWYYAKRYGKVQQGQVFGVFFALLFFDRFLLEYTKINEGISEDALINMGQILSIPFILIGLYLAWSKNKPPTPKTY
ncbi:prolipoprotein diacylglyceryl transferase [Saprospira grandis]|uniref:prolipoprotein diacylglyceryl transferase n=1 Tax=Saprospira grandis TaxID=1008 RepID=UPI0022DDB716|nr:prolipoprotein diacylglyceryl transferase [Saprospira grandis]WBM73738.1 prolipoprotein diacylglyceryl transferase [Saprospira grandis]